MDSPVLPFVLFRSIQPLFAASAALIHDQGFSTKQRPMQDGQWPVVELPVGAKSAQLTGESHPGNISRAARLCHPLFGLRWQVDAASEAKAANKPSLASA